MIKYMFNVCLLKLYYLNSNKYYILFVVCIHCLIKHKSFVGIIDNNLQPFLSLISIFIILDCYYYNIQDVDYRCNVFYVF